MADIIREAPELHAAVKQLAREHVRIPAPPQYDGKPRYWLGCDACSAVVAAPAGVVSTICEDCCAPCPHADCGLRIFEHIDGCEPLVAQEDADPEAGSSLAAAHVGQIRVWWADPWQASIEEVAELVGAVVDQAWGEGATLFRFDDGSAVRICGQDVDVLKR